MSSEQTMTMLSGAEFLLSALLGFLFFSKKLQRRFPAMGYYLGLRVISSPILWVLLAMYSQPWGKKPVYFLSYFFVYWTVYIASAVLLFFVCMEIFRSALSSFSGLTRLGTVVFRWVAVVSLIVSFSAVSFQHQGLRSIASVAVGMMRSVSVIELCLLAFLCLCMNALDLSPRDLAFGFALGFGVMAANDFVVVSLISHNASLTAPLQFVYQGIMLAALCTWIAYAALPEPARKPIVIAATSTIYRWNEIASALGHSGTKVAVPAPATSSFFLTDVEKVVEKVLNKNNLQQSETNS